MPCPALRAIGAQETEGVNYVAMPFFTGLLRDAFPYLATLSTKDASVIAWVLVFVLESLQYALYAPASLAISVLTSASRTALRTSLSIILISCNRLFVHLMGMVYNCNACNHLLLLPPCTHLLLHLMGMVYNNACNHLL